MSVSIYVQPKGIHGPAFEVMNQSNDNFERLCALLGLAFSSEGGAISGQALQDFQVAIDFVLGSLTAMPELDNGTADRVSMGKLGCLMIDCGLRAGYFREKLLILKPVVDLAVLNHGSIYWC